MRILAVIPARGGSKRVPNKNIALLEGRPLIAYTCQAALDSRQFAAVYCNTDSHKISAVARHYGVSTPILRPKALAQDDTSTALATRFFLSYLQEHGENFDAFALLQPTSPLRTADDIRAALALYEQNLPCTVVSATRAAPAHWLGRVTKDGRFDPLPGEDPLFRLNGAIYVYPFAPYLCGELPARTLMYPMPPDRSIDIDTPLDWQIAEALLAPSRTRQHEPV